MPDPDVSTISVIQSELLSRLALNDRTVAKPEVVAGIANSDSCLPGGRLRQEDDPRSASSCGANEELLAGKPLIIWQIVGPTVGRKARRQSFSYERTLRHCVFDLLIR